MPDESLDYRDHRLDLYRSGPGWRVCIYAPEDKWSLQTIPFSRRQDGRDDVLREARTVVDRRLRSASPPRAANPSPAIPVPAARWRWLLTLLRRRR